MLKRLKPKQVFYISLIISSFFLLICFSHYFVGSKFSKNLMGIIAESLFIPMTLVVLPVAFFVSLKHLTQDKWSPKTYSFYAFVILLVNLVLVWGAIVYTYM